MPGEFQSLGWRGRLTPAHVSAVIARIGPIPLDAHVLGNGTAGGSAALAGGLNGFFPIAGLSAAAAAAAAALAAIIVLGGGTSAGAAVVAGDIVPASQLSGSVAGSAGSSGLLSGSLQLPGGTAGGTTTAAATFDTLVLSGGAANGTATAAGVLLAPLFVGGTSTGNGSLIGSLSLLGSLSGSSAGEASVEAALLASGLAGTAAGSATVAGEFSASDLAGTAAGTGSASGGLAGVLVLAGSSAGSATVSGNLEAGGATDYEIPSYLLPAAGTFQAAGIGEDITPTLVNGITVYTTISSTGTTADRQAAIQTAMNDCPENQAVVLGAGRFNISGAIGFSFQKHNRHLFGSVDATGKPTTILYPTGGNTAVQLGTGFEFTLATTGVAASFTKGATTLEVADSSAFFVNRLARIEIANEADTPVMSVYGYEWARGQLVFVTAKPDSTHITIESPGLHMDFSHATAIRILHEQNGFIGRGNGIANIKVDVTEHANYGDSGFYFNPFTIENSYRSWIYNSHAYRAGNYGFTLNQSLRCQLERVWAQGEDNGSSTAGIFVAFCAQCLFTDFIISDQPFSVLSQYSNSGNVFSYYVCNPGSATPNPVQLATLNVNHDPFAQCTLLEGGHVQFTFNDGYFGGAGWTVQYRNNIYAAVASKRWSRNDVVVGNVHGTVGTDSGGYSLGDPYMGNSNSAGTTSMRGALSTLSARVSASEGTVTAPSGHGITTGSTVDVYWNFFDGSYNISKIRRGMVVGTVSGTSIPVSGGSGDDLPSASAAVYVPTTNAAIRDYSIDWDSTLGRSKSWGGTLTTRTDAYSGQITLSTGLGASLQASIAAAASGDITRGLWLGAVGASALVNFINITDITGDVVTFTGNSFNASLPTVGSAVNIVPCPQNYPEKDMDVILTMFARANYKSAVSGAGIPSHESIGGSTLAPSMHRTSAPPGFAEAGLAWPPYDPFAAASGYTRLPAGVAMDAGWWVLSTTLAGSSAGAATVAGDLVGSGPLVGSSAGTGTAGAVFAGGDNSLAGSAAGSAGVSAAFQSSATALLTDIVEGTLRNNFTGLIGFKFTVGAQPLTVSQLGRWKHSGNSGSHVVKLVKASDGVDVSGGSVTVSMSGGTIGQVTYVDLTAPVVLDASTAYYLVSEETSGGDQWFDYADTIVTLDAAVTWNAGIWNAGSYNEIGTVGQSYVVPDMMFTVGASSDLAGSVTGTGTAAGALEAPMLAGSTAGTGATSGTLGASTLAGSSAGSASLAGALNMAGVLDGEGAAEGFAEVSGSIVAPGLSGSTAGTGSTSGALDAPLLSGSVAGAGSAAGVLVAPLLAGSSAGTGAASGALVAPTLAGSVAGTGSTSGALEAPATAVGITELAHGTSTSASTNTASVSPAADAHVFVAVEFSVAGGGSVVLGSEEVTVSGGGISTWVEVARRAWGSRRGALVFRGTSASPGSGAITIAFSNLGGTFEQVKYCVAQATNVNASTPIGTAQSSASSAVTSHDSASVGTIDSGDLVFALFGLESNEASVTISAGTTLRHINDATGARTLVLFTNTTDNTPGLTWTEAGGSSVGSIAFIINKT